MDQSKTCGECEYCYDGSLGGTIECRRFPPTWPPGARQWRFPEIKPNSPSCGEFEQITEQGGTAKESEVTNSENAVSDTDETGEASKDETKTTGEALAGIDTGEKAEG